jgi:hypothetical protein
VGVFFHQLLLSFNTSGIKYDLVDEEILKRYFELIVTRIYEKFELWVNKEVMIYF